MTTGQEMLDWAKDLFPICRSLTGNGVRETMAYLRKIHPEIQPHSFATGETVFDWTIPEEWNISDAYIEHLETGQRFADFARCNLHVLGYAEPIDTVMDLEDLLPHIYTQPDQPEVIPYVTSYYVRRWGFCMSHQEKIALPKGPYRVVIRSQLTEGELILGEALIPGVTKQEIMFSTNICHPSMANNETSGLVVMMAMMQFVKERSAQNRYSYRFLLVPETIGSIAYLSRHMEEMQRNIICGFCLSCVGDERAYSHIQSPYGDTLADQALRSALLSRENVGTYPYMERGSDERQYCAPGIRLPVVGFCRSKYTKFPEYHTSADDFDLVTAEGMEGALAVLSEIIEAFEIGLYPKCVILGEPQLGKRGLYPTVSQKDTYTAVWDRRNFLAYADGRNSLFDIVRITGIPLRTVLEETQILLRHGVVSVSDTKLQ